MGRVWWVGGGKWWWVGGGGVGLSSAGTPVPGEASTPGHQQNRGNVWLPVSEDRVGTKIRSPKAKSKNSTLPSLGAPSGQALLPHYLRCCGTHQGALLVDIGSHVKLRREHVCVATADARGRCNVTTGVMPHEGPGHTGCRPGLGREFWLYLSLTCDLRQVPCIYEKGFKKHPSYRTMWPGTSLSSTEHLAKAGLAVKGFRRVRYCSCEVTTYVNKHERKQLR